MTKHILLAATALATLTIMPAYAHDGDGGNVTYATDHAPIGVMADHRHKKGEVMLSYRYMYMDMNGNRDDTNSLSPEDVTGFANPYANPPMSPPGLRVVPVSMPMQMHMVGGMYGLSDRITIMAMGNYLTNEMDHVTFQGPMGTTRLGEFTTKSSGFGDTTIGAIIGLDDGSKAHRQVNLGLAVSLPTGSNTQTDDVLTPMNTRPTLRLPYPMQLGSGTIDFKPSLTARSRKDRWSFGMQASATVRLEDNKEGYKFGDIFGATAWTAYESKPYLSFSGRIKAETKGDISGNDAAVRAPVQTADPANHGGEVVEALIGVNLAGQTGWQKGHRLAFEIGVPIYRNLNGPQLETDMTLTFGWQKAF